MLNSLAGGTLSRGWGFLFSEFGSIGDWADRILGARYHFEPICTTILRKVAKTNFDRKFLLYAIVWLLQKNENSFWAPWAGNPIFS